MSGVSLELTLPPSINRAYRNVQGRGRVATDDLKNWKRNAGWEIHLARCGRVTGPYTLSILVPSTMRGDVDNRIKAISDILVAHTVTPDDRMAKRMSVERSSDVRRGCCLVTVEAVCPSEE